MLETNPSLTMIETIADTDRLIVFTMPAGGVRGRPKARPATWAKIREMLAASLGVTDLLSINRAQGQAIVENTSRFDRLIDEVLSTHETVARTQGNIDTLAQAVAISLTAEAKARGDLEVRVDKVEKKILPFVGVNLVLAAGIAISGGKSERTVSVPGLKKGDGLAVSANASLPSSVTISEVMCRKDGELTVVLVNTGLLLAIGAAATIPLTCVAVRP